MMKSQHNTTDVSIAHTSQPHSGDLLDNLVLGMAAYTGKSFFPALLKQLSNALGATHALLSEVTEEGTRLRPLVFWSRGRFATMPEFEWRGSVCGSVLESDDLRYYASGVQQMFPAFEGLSALGVDSYLGAPLPGPSGKPMGTLCAMGAWPLEIEERSRTIFRIFAARAAAELRRVRAEEAVRAEIQERLRAEQASRAQVAVVAKTLNFMTTERDVDQAVGHVLGIIASEFGATAAELWVVAADDACHQPTWPDYCNQRRSFTRSVCRSASQ